MIFMSDRRAEKGHDAVAGILVHRTFEAVNAVTEDLAEAVQDLVPLFGIDLLGEVHRALHVSKEYRHLLALALEGGLRLQDLLGEVFWGIGSRLRRRSHGA